MTTLNEKLKQLEEKGRYRTLAKAAGLDLTSNDYLGFACSEMLHKVAIAALSSGLDIGSGGSRLLRGNHSAHVELEDFAATYFKAERALYFSSGYQANAALFQSLPARGDVIIFDAFVHASAREGIQNSHARHVRVPHNDLQAFEDALKVNRDKAGQIWIAVESLYSMDGDFAPLDDLLHLARDYEAWLIVDEAHATGVWGKSGKGCCEGLSYERLITLQTCGKALGVAGGLITAPSMAVETMINTARSFVYSTAPMPLQAVLVKRALEMLQQKEGQEARDKLHALIKSVPEAQSQIVPIIIGDDAQAVSVASMLQERGYDIRAIRPPTVPEGTARLRLSVSAALSQDELNEFFAALDDVQKREAA